jgi:hypothetical protein
MHQDVPLDKGPPFPRVDWILKPPQTGKLIVSVRRPNGKTPAPDGYKVGYMRTGDPQPDGPKPGTPGPHIYYRWEADRWGRTSGSVLVNGGVARGELEPGAYDLSLPLLPLTDSPAEKRTDLTSYFSHPASWGKRFTIEATKVTELAVTQPAASALTIQVTNPAGKPIAGINLAAFRWNEESRSYGGTWGSTATNADGQVLFDPLLPGRYVFHPATGGTDYEPLKRYPITLVPGKHHRLKMVMSQTDIDLLKKRTDLPVRLRGQVFLPDGLTPAAFAAVYQGRESCCLEGSGQAITADAEGRFSLETWSFAPPLTIAARSHGTALTLTNVAITRADPPPIRLVLQAGATIHGRVVTRDTTPATDVRICALAEPSMSEPRVLGGPRGEGNHSLATPVRRDGSFTLYGVHPGKQHLCLYRQGRLQISSIHPLDLRPGETRKGVHLVLQPERDGLEIHFRRAAELPMPESYEARLYTDYGSLHCGGLDEKGAIARSRDPLPGGRYHLWLDTTSVQQKLDMLPGLLVRNIQVRPGKGLQKIELTLPSAGAIQGRVLLPDGTPAAALRVAVHVAGLPRERSVYAPLSLVRDGTGPASYAETWIDPAGEFTLFGLAPGRYRLAVSLHGQQKSLFVSEPLDVKASRTTRAGTWTIGAE